MKGGGGAFNLASERGVGGVVGEAADDDLYTCSHRTLGRGVTSQDQLHILHRKQGV